MEIKQFYENVGGDYKAALELFQGDERILKFLKMLLDDPSYSELKTSFSAGDWETAFRAIHTIKGLCMSLSFSRLQEKASRLTESIRSGAPTEDAPKFYLDFAAEYDATINQLNKLLEG